jgi:hypothetical protein
VKCKYFQRHTYLYYIRSSHYNICTVYTYIHTLGIYGNNIYFTCASMELPVVLWSSCSLADMNLKLTSACVTSCDETQASSLIMICGTTTGPLLLFRSNSSKPWTLDSLLLKHTTSVPGLSIGTNEWGESICVSVSKDGAVGIWLLEDGRCMDWKEHLAAEISPIQGYEV